MSQISESRLISTKGIHPMADPIQQFIFASLRDMDYDTEGLDGSSQLGPRGADVDSLGLAELAIRVEDEFGVKFGEEEAEELAGATVAEFCAAVRERMATAAAAAE
jgi:acyl carrier protein